MKIKYLFFLLVVFLVVDIGAVTRQEAFLRYLDKLDEVSGDRLTEIQKNELMRPRTLKDYDPEFVHTAEYTRRRAYDDITQDRLIEEWKQHNVDRLWRCDHELHHIIPLGYGGRNVWWNIFPLTQRDHRSANTGIHGSDEFRQLFPLVR